MSAPITWAPTAKDLTALAILRAGDAAIEGRATQGHDQPGGAIVHQVTAERLQSFGWAIAYEVGRIMPRWRLRITENGRKKTVTFEQAS